MHNTTKLVEEAESEWLRNILFHIRMWFLPVVVIGTVMNVINFVVLNKKEMKRLSTSIYLLALAFADLGVMYFELFRVWFEWTDFVDPALYFTDTYCKFANFFNGITRDYSNWLIACLTLERLVMVAYPYKAKTLCTVKNARMVTLSLIILITVPHTHCLIFSVAQKEVWWVCWEDPKSKVASVIAAIVEFSVGYVVVIVVFILNITLIVFLYGKKPRCCYPHGNDVRHVRGKKLTKTLLLIACVFLICETPRIIMSFICRFLQRTTTRRIILNLAYLVSGINHASNFFIYIFSSPRFRLIFLETFAARYCPQNETMIRIGRLSPLVMRVRTEESGSPASAGKSTPGTPQTPSSQE